MRDIKAFETAVSHIKHAKNALPNAFQIGYQETIGDLKNAEFYLVETVLTDVAWRGKVDNLCEQNTV